MPSLRLVAVVVLAVAFLPACHAEPEAKYSESLGACELPPREAAIRLTGAGAKIGAAQANAAVTVRLSGRDCCVQKVVEMDTQTANGRRIRLATATAADQTLLGR